MAKKNETAAEQTPAVEKKNETAAEQTPAVEKKNETAAEQTPAVEKKNETAAKKPAAESKNAKKAKEIFARHPDRPELFFTGDGLAFFERSDAVNHARTLKAQEIETVKK
jgi:hypothetical protein